MLIATKTLARISALAGLALMTLVALPQAAQASCEHIKDAFAYNDCLSKSAPPAARRGGGKSEAGADPEASVPERGRAREARRSRGRGGAGIAISGRGSRTRAVIDPWSGARGAAPRARRRR